MQAPIPSPIFDSILILEFLRYVLVILLVIYAIFALLIVRQVQLMAKTLITPVSPIVVALAIVHAGFAVGLTVFIIGTL